MHGNREGWPVLALHGTLSSIMVWASADLYVLSVLRCSRGDKAESVLPPPPAADASDDIALKAAASAEPTKAGIVTAADIKAKEAKVKPVCGPVVSTVRA